MKILVTVIATLLVLTGITYLVTHFTHSNFVDYSSFIGMVISLLLWFFSSKGGYLRQGVDTVPILGSIDTATKPVAFEFKPSVIFFTSFAYTIVSFIFMAIKYKDFF